MLMPTHTSANGRHAVDLRWRLFGYVLGFALALLAAVAAWVGLALRDDVADEMAAAARLVDVVQAAAQAGVRVIARLNLSDGLAESADSAGPDTAPVGH